MKTPTTWRRGFTPGAGRKPGSRNRVKAEVRQLMRRLEKADTLHPEVWFERLETIARNADPAASVAAIRVLAEFRFGKPMQESELSVSHELGPSITEMLEAISRSPEHRQRLEERERKRLAVTVEAEPPS